MVFIRITEKKEKEFTCQCCQGQNQEPAAHRHLFTTGAAREWDTKQQRDVYGLRSVRRTVCVSLEGTCVWASACKSRSVLTPSISPFLLFCRIIHYLLLGQSSEELRGWVGSRSPNWEDPCFVCADVTVWKTGTLTKGVMLKLALFIFNTSPNTMPIQWVRGCTN